MSEIPKEIWLDLSEHGGGALGDRSYYATDFQPGPDVPAAKFVRPYRGEATESEKRMLACFPPAVRELSFGLRMFLVWNAINTLALFIIVIYLLS